jgi:hypothetical protein
MRRMGGQRKEMTEGMGPPHVKQGKSVCPVQWMGVLEVLELELVVAATVSGTWASR